MDKHEQRAREFYLKHCTGSVNVTALAAEFAAVEKEAPINAMAARVVAMCAARRWSMHWTHRGAYLHLESSELIEAIRGKHGDPLSEAGDVLLVLMSITEHAGFPFSQVIQAAEQKLQRLETCGPYKGEETTHDPSVLDKESILT